MSKRWNSKEFFESNERSRELRDVVVQILQIVHGLLYEQYEEDAKCNAYALLEHLGGELNGMGIQHEMDTGYTEEEYKNDPVKTAQYIAGQALWLTGEDMKSIVDILPQIGECSTYAHHGNEHNYVLENSDIPRSVKEWEIRNSIVKRLSKLLDCNAEFNGEE